MRPSRGPRESVPEGHRRCPDCEQVLPFTAFPRNRNTKSGFATYCKPCQNVRSRESRDRLHGGSRHHHLKRRYGLGAGEVEVMIKEQFGICPICLTPGPQHVDHDHLTGMVRSVLCFNCNGGLGQFKDNPELLRRAADYVEGNVWKPTLVAPGVYQLPS
ncbi:endonuclease VII domain-containing protein [Streptomyces sp. NPDC001070]